MTIDKVKLRDKKNTIYLPSTSYKDFYRNNFTIVYPNNGSKEAPANITVNSKYIVENPFPGYHVNCEAEIFYANKWIHQRYNSHYGSSGIGWAIGIYCNQYNEDKIVMITGSYDLTIAANNSYSRTIYPTLHDVDVSIATAPARIKVWKVGIIDE